MNESFSIKNAIGFGVGVGANILTRFTVCIYFEINFSSFDLFSVKISNKSLRTYFG
jgi:hypothetical protein